MAFYDREVVALMERVPDLGAANPMGLIVRVGIWWRVVLLDEADERTYRIHLSRLMSEGINPVELMCPRSAP